MLSSAAKTIYSTFFVRLTRQKLYSAYESILMGKNARFAFSLDIKLALDELFELRFPLRVSARSGARRGSKNISLNTARSSKSFLDQMHLHRDIKEIGLPSFRLNLFHARDIFQREATM